MIALETYDAACHPVSNLYLLSRGGRVGLVALPNPHQDEHRGPIASRREGFRTARTKQ